MAEIHVVIPGGAGSTIVHNDPKPVMGGRIINWHVHCYDPGVKQVELEFEVPYFPPGNPDPRKCRKTLQEESKGEFGCTIWGTAPVNAEQQKVDKYTVRCFGNGGSSLTELDLDPEIINDRPR